MIVELNGLLFETVGGTWNAEYIGEPSGLYDSDRVQYYIKFKWLDLNNPENEASTERRLRLVTYHSQSAYSDYEEKLIKAIQLWLDSIEVRLDSTEDIEAVYVYPSVTLQSPIS